MREAREFDLVVYGATGDAGHAISSYLANNQRGDPIKWAVAGRNKSKLEALVDKLGGPSKPAVLIADSGDAASLLRMAERATLVCSAAGPYVLIGEPVMAACIEAKTHYADITGEVHWVGEMARKYEARAIERGVALASFCGYDSIPCSLSAHVARTSLKLGAKHEEQLFVECVSILGKGGVPHGTLMTALEALGVDRVLRFARGWAALAGHSNLLPSIRSMLGSACFGWSPQVGSFTLPHFMAWCNVPVLHRAYGGEGPLRFLDRQQLPIPSAWWNLWHLLPILMIYASFCIGFPLLFLAASLPPARRWAQRILLTYSYAGDADTSFTIKARAQCGNKASTITFGCRGDVGIYATALLAAESSLALIASACRGELSPGFTTPAVALGDALVLQLREAGCKVEAKPHV